MPDIRVRHEDLVKFFAACYGKVGVAEQDARLIAEILGELELRGIATHGAIRVPFYIRRLQRGGVNPRPNMRLEKDYPASGILHADNAPGQLAASRGMQIAMDKARRCGVGFVVVRDSDHFGAAASYAMQAMRQDMVGMVWSNGYPSMAAWGGYGTNITNAPLAYAVPAGKKPPIVLDISMSAVSGGTVRLAAKKGQKIPLTWVVNKQGRPTDDPNDLPNGGALLPMGMHKGYGLAVIGEVLNGILAGGPFLGDVVLWFANPDKHSGTGHVLMAVDIGKFRDLAEFKSDVDQLIDRLKATPTMEGFSEVLVPGEIETRKTAQHLRDGIPITEPVMKDLRDLARDLGVSVLTGRA